MRNRKLSAANRRRRLQREIDRVFREFINAPHLLPFEVARVRADWDYQHSTREDRAVIESYIRLKEQNAVREGVEL